MNAPTNISQLKPEPEIPATETSAAEIPATEQPKPLANRFKPLMARDDQEFLPAAIEILERPGSPIAFVMLPGICALALIALVWAWFGWTDIVAVAPGKIQPTGRVKIVQPLEAGKVKAILAVNGVRVKEGDPLILLEPDDAIADEIALRSALGSSLAEIIRRDAVIKSATDLQISVKLIDWPDTIPANARAREDAVYRADMESLIGQTRAIDAQRAQKEAEKSRLANTLLAQDAVLATLQERVDMRTTLLNTNAGSRATVIDALETLNTQTAILVGQRGQLLEAERAVDSLNAERERLVRGFIADNMNKRLEALRQSDELAQRWTKSQLRVERMTLRSPADGLVQASNVTSIGQVLPAGQEIMRVVPSEGPLEIEVYLQNRDIGFVHEGQSASLKIEAFPFTRYGTVEAKVVRVATDAIPAPDASQMAGDPARPAESRGIAGGQHTQNLVFPVILKAEKASIDADGRTVALSPGMAVTAEIKTGKRRIIDYVFSPLVEVASTAIKER